MSVLTVDNLDVRFDTPDGEVHAVRDLCFELAAGETLGIVGESGSGKSQTVLSLLGLLAANGRVSGRATFELRDLLALSERERRAIRGRKISMIFQDPMTSLNPYLTIAAQMVRSCARTSAWAQRPRARAASRCSTPSRFPRRRRASTATRTSSRAACVSA